MVSTRVHVPCALLVALLLQAGDAVAFISLSTTTRPSSFGLATTPPSAPLSATKEQQQQVASVVTNPTATTTTVKRKSGSNYYAPRTGLAQSLLNIALNSPLWEYVLVPQARHTMVQTAEANGIEWRTLAAWIRKQQQQLITNNTDTDSNGDPNGADEDDDDTLQNNLHNDMTLPEYYQQAAFHAYPQGNLCWEAAFEQEIASRAVGARNFPQFAAEGETVFRQAFQRGLQEAGARLPSGKDPVVAVDIGCGTGLSSRQLATTEFLTEDGNDDDEDDDASGGKNRRFLDQVIGIDLSPYFIEVGKTLLHLDIATAKSWANPIDPRAKQVVELRVAGAEDTGLTSNSVDIVQILFVLHELPPTAAASVLQEAHRIVKPGGQVWMGEMDFEAPAYAAQRANALLFSLIRATEPYLDDYADGFATHIKPTLEALFESVTWTAATGRHYAMVATKGLDDHQKGSSCKVLDKRFQSNGDYAVEDTHLQLWESKQET